MNLRATRKKPMRFIKKYLIFLLCFANIISSFADFGIVSAENSKVDLAMQNARNYIIANKNETEKADIEGVLNSVLENAEIEDFYIKNAINGVKDDCELYPLDIKGEDGAVTVFFRYAGNRYGFTAAFPHTVQKIEINSFAVVGDKNYSDYFSFDSNGDVISVNKAVDKIIFPSDYSGTMKFVQNKNFENDVKVVIYNTNKGFMDQGFRAWSGLVAFQMGQTSRFTVGAACANGYARYTFKDCANLKYFKFPENISSIGGVWNSDNYPFHRDFFYNCEKLETVIMPKHIAGAGNMDTSAAIFGIDSFYNTAVREIYLPAINNAMTYTPADNFEDVTFSEPSFSKGSRNIHLYKEDMTFLRAVSLASAVLNITDANDTERDIYSLISDKIFDASNQDKFNFTISEFTDKMNSNATVLERSFVFSACGEALKLEKEYNIGLSELSLENIKLSPSFSYDITEYVAETTEINTEVNIVAVPFEGAQIISIEGNKNLSVGDNFITVSVKNSLGNTVNYTVNLKVKKDLNYQVCSLAEQYVEMNRNEATLDGLLESVKRVSPDITLSANDFYIKHSVPGVTDNDFESWYKLNIAGSYGAVTAIFTLGDIRIPFNTTFDYQIEKLNINSYAIVGNSLYNDVFAYDSNGNVIDIKKPVDKIIFPDGYKGTMNALSSEKSMLNADRVKVVIYNGLGDLVSDSFYDWNGLIAVLMGDQTHNQWGFALAKNGSAAFAECDSLKYFKFPNHINTSGYNAGGTVFPNTFFMNSRRLENVVLPTKVNGISKWYNEADKTVSYGFKSFWGTAVREIILPKINMNEGMNSPALGDNVQTFISPSFSGGTSNVHYYSDAMTFSRAIAYMSSSLKETVCVSETDIINAAKRSVYGSIDAAEFTDNLSFKWEEKNSDSYFLRGKLIVSDGLDAFELDLSFSKTLSSLSIKGFELSEKYMPDRLQYSVIVPFDQSKIEIEYKTVTGVKRTVISNITTLLPFNITTKNTDGKTVIYSISVYREGSLDSSTLLSERKALLGVEGGIQVDLNSDRACTILDLIRMKKLIAEGDIKDTRNIIKVGTGVDGLYADTFKETLGYVDKDGNTVDTLFGAVTFMPYPNWLYSYDSSNPRTHSKREWSQFIYSNLLQDGYNLDAVNISAGKLKQKLDIPNYKVTIYLPLFTTSFGFTGFGEVNGVALDFNKNTDRVTAQKWLVDEMIGAFEGREFEHLALGGFYYVSEGISKDDEENLKITLPIINEYINKAGYISYFAPFNGANGSYESSVPKWYEYGFDKATYQSNYFPETGLPNAQTNPICIYNVSQRAKKLGANMEMELCGDLKVHITAFKKYLQYGVTEGFMKDDFIGWWIQNNSKMLTFLCYNEDDYMRSAYDEIYMFIKEKLVLSDINVEK